MGYSLEYASSVQEDTDALSDEEFAVVDELFTLLHDNALVLEAVACCSYRNIDKPRFDASMLVQWEQESFNVGYIKVWQADGSLVGARVIYGVDHAPPRPRVVVLGVMKRDEDYEMDSDYGRRLQEDYERHHIPRIPRC